MRRFFFCSGDRIGNTVMLKGGEARHLSVVIRAGVGKMVVLFNEKGEKFIASVVKVAPGVVKLAVEEKVQAGPCLPGVLHIAVAHTKAKALERVLSSATELGAGKIIVFRCGRSVPRLRRSDLGDKLNRWKRVTLAATKQCGRPAPADVEYLHAWGDLLEVMERYDRVYIALDAGARQRFTIDPQKKVLVVVGPEGGFTDAEASAAIGAGALPLGLGPFTLRSDTAAIAAVALIVNAFYSCRS